MRGFPSAGDAGVACAAVRAFVNQVDARRRTVRLVANERVGERFAVVGKLPIRGELGAAALFPHDFPAAGRFNGNGNGAAKNSGLVGAIRHQGLGVADTGKGEGVAVCACGRDRHLVGEFALGEVELPFADEGLIRGAGHRCSADAQNGDGCE